MSKNGRKWAAIAGFSALVSSLATTPGFGCGSEAETGASTGTPGGTGAGGGAGGGDTTLSVGASSGAGMVECPTPCQMNEVCSHGV
ncbi:MAG TPA: hypothetical protein VK459_19110 [Polyangiaceae bacterium]|nr:hypothetical protein [Polyangiaceae bacterium]